MYHTTHSTAADLKDLISSIHRKSYPACKSLAGNYTFEKFTLTINHVQGDPFASPSHISIRVPHRFAGFPTEFFNTPWRKTALEDTLLRSCAAELAKYSFRAKGSGKSGLLATSIPGQEILPRSACQITNHEIILRLEAGFPANGRTIQGQELEKMLLDFIPSCVHTALFYRPEKYAQLQKDIHLADDQHALRQFLTEHHLSAFVADGAILPRESGISQKPMKHAVPFSSPDTLRVSCTLPHHGILTGMGIREGITLIVGGGYHGKSTLLNALEMGVYNHISGDGREYVVTDSSALKLRSEDGRSVRNVDISLFIKDLPNNKDTAAFYTEDASGSTSQAAAVMEGIESGSHLFLIDEDTSATNFMMRDELMQKVIHREKEPITPFLERARDLFEQDRISTILVAGSSGAYFYIADTIIQLDHYLPYDITVQALAASRSYPAPAIKAPGYHIGMFCRVPEHKAEHPAQKKHTPMKNHHQKIKVYGKDCFLLGKDTVELRYLSQLANCEQTNTLAHLLRYAQAHYFDGTYTLTQIVDLLEEELEKNQFQNICKNRFVPCRLCLPRRQEIFSCFNRYRKL